MDATTRTGTSNVRQIISRRALLRGALAVGGLSLLSACAPAATPAAKPTEAPKPAESKPAAPAATTAPAAAAKPTEAPAAAKPAESKPAAPAATTAPAAGKPAANRVINWGTDSDVSRINPQYSVQFVDVGVYDNVYDQLNWRDADLKLVPGLATEWKLVNDTTWQFKLRQGAKFHNGDPVTAADVKFTIERTYNPEAKTLVSLVYSTVDHVDVVDDLTVNFVMKKSDPLLPARTASWGGYILPAKYFESTGMDEFEKKPVGSGPYRVVEWVKGDRLVLEANPNYWGGTPNVPQIIVRPKPEAASRIAALIAGDTQLANEVPPDQVDRINKSDTSKVITTPYAGMTVLNVNSKVPPLDKKEIRQALSLAIDREAITKDLLLGQAIVPNGSIVKGDFAYDASLPPLPYDQAKAKQLLAQGGYKGEEIGVEILERDRAVTEAVLGMWKSVGINTKLEVLENAVRVQKQTTKTFKGIYPGGPGSSVGDPDGMMWRILGPGGLWENWQDPEFTRLGEEARFSLDQTLRQKNYSRMNQILNENFPWIPLYQQNLIYGAAKWVNWKPFSNARVEFRTSNLTVS